MKARALSTFLIIKGDLLKSGILGSTVIAGSCFLCAVLLIIYVFKFTFLFSGDQEGFVISIFSKRLPILIKKALNFEVSIDFQ